MLRPERAPTVSKMGKFEASGNVFGLCVRPGGVISTCEGSALSEGRRIGTYSVGARGYTWNLPSPWRINHSQSADTEMLPRWVTVGLTSYMSHWREAAGQRLATD